MHFPRTNLKVGIRGHVLTRQLHFAMNGTEACAFSAWDGSSCFHGSQCDSSKRRPWMSEGWV
eukprot:1161932-Pelagomonas_calceolata.AAC.8